MTNGDIPKGEAPNPAPELSLGDRLRSLASTALRALGKIDFTADERGLRAQGLAQAREDEQRRQQQERNL